MESHLHFALGDGHVGGHVDEVAEDLPGLTLGVSAHALGESTIQPAGNDEQRHVEVDLHRDGRRQGVDVKEAHRIADRVLDEHALGISGDERLGRTRVVGQQHGGLVMTEVEDVELAQAATGERDGFLPHAGGLVLAGGHIEPNPSPGRDGEVADLGEDLRGATSQGDEGHAHGVEAGEPGVGGQARIEHHMRGERAMGALPEVEEAEHRLGLLALAQVRIGVAERAGVGILCEEDEDARLAPAAFGHIVALDARVRSVVGHGVEVEVERTGGEQRLLAEHRAVPGAEQGAGVFGRDARGVLAEIALLRDAVQRAEQPQPLVGDERHHVALALDGPELEREAGTQRVGAGNHLRAGQPGGVGHRFDAHSGL